MLVGQSILLCRRSINQQDIPVVCELQDTCHIIGMQLADLIHHTVQLEFGKFGGSITFENIQQHDIHHRLDQDIRTLRAYISQPLNEPRIIPVLDDAEFQIEEVCQPDQVSRMRIHRLD